MLVLRRIHHLRCEDTRRAVKRREGLVELSHMSADGRQLFNDIHIVSGIGNIKRRLNTCDTAADDERAFGDGAFAGGKRCIKLNLCHCGTGKHYRLCGRLGLVLMYP